MAYITPPNLLQKQPILSSLYTNPPSPTSQLQYVYVPTKSIPLHPTANKTSPTVPSTYISYVQPRANLPLDSRPPFDSQPTYAVDIPNTRSVSLPLVSRPPLDSQPTPTADTPNTQPVSLPLDSRPPFDSQPTHTVDTPNTRPVKLPLDSRPVDLPLDSQPTHIVDIPNTQPANLPLDSQNYLEI
ncbi:10736_t:CDS:1 [Scutellospora calospora]|uniref:10736_t:CDS:1 n=1 Tax=Scutellospora calospora TaxID=85575 RepID=A0ACA9LQX0_9GLOM|nr:10736_t:CDS:1 [Scutellospora calospora]